MLENVVQESDDNERTENIGTDDTDWESSKGYDRSIPLIREYLNDIGKHLLLSDEERNVKYEAKIDLQTKILREIGHWDVSILFNEIRNSTQKNKVTECKKIKVTDGKKIINKKLYDSLSDFENRLRHIRKISPCKGVISEMAVFYGNQKLSHECLLGICQQYEQRCRQPTADFNENYSKLEQIYYDLNIADLRFVVNIAKKYASKYFSTGVPFTDLIAMGNQSLMKSIDYFDYQTGVPFVAYAKPAIHRHIKNGIRKFLKTTGLSGPGVIYLDEYSGDDGESGGSMNMNETLAEINEVMEQRTTPTSVFGSSDEEKLSDTFSKLLSSLNEKDRYLIETQFGIGDAEELSQTEIAERQGVSRNAISKHTKKILMHLGKSPAGQELKRLMFE